MVIKALSIRLWHIVNGQEIRALLFKLFSLYQSFLILLLALYLAGYEYMPAIGLMDTYGHCRIGYATQFWVTVHDATRWKDRWR